MKANVLLFSLLLLPFAAHAQTALLDSLNREKKTLEERLIEIERQIAIETNGIDRKDDTDVVDQAVVRNPATVRDKPSATGIMLATIDRGVSVQIFERRGGYALIKHGDVQGWVQESLYLMTGEEAEKHERKEHEKQARRDGKTLLIRDVDALYPNSADGVDVRVHWEHLHPTKTVKYIWFTVAGYNAVGDAQRGRIRGLHEVRLSATGPIEPGDIVQIGTWETIWYNQTITCAALKRVEVEYLDGTKEIYVRDLPQIVEISELLSCTMDAQRVRDQRIID